MKTIEKRNLTGNLWINRKTGLKPALILLFTLSFLILPANVTFAHCDTMDGPVIKDARKAMETNNVNYALKWVQPGDEAELKEAFILTMKVRNLNPDARILADKYFFRPARKAAQERRRFPFTGVKPSGTPIDEKILAADKSIETGDLTPLKGLVPAESVPELTERFEKAMSLRNSDIINVEAGRAYVEAYVQFFKFAEGEEENHNEASAISHSVHNH